MPKTRRGVEREDKVAEILEAADPVDRLRRVHVHRRRLTKLGAQSSSMMKLVRSRANRRLDTASQLDGL